MNECSMRSQTHPQNDFPYYYVRYQSRASGTILPVLYRSSSPPINYEGTIRSIATSITTTSCS